jgi:hypothetical protein
VLFNLALSGNAASTCLWNEQLTCTKRHMPNVPGRETLGNSNYAALQIDLTGNHTKQETLASGGRESVQWPGEGYSWQTTTPHELSGSVNAS